MVRRALSHSRSELITVPVCDADSRDELALRMMRFARPTGLAVLAVPASYLAAFCTNYHDLHQFRESALHVFGPERRMDSWSTRCNIICRTQ
jgi:hypothetical protein